MGGIDILVNNAGITKDNLTLRMKEDEWKDVIDVNLNSVFFMCQFAIKSMIKNKIWQYNKYYFCGWPYWKCWSGKLYSI